MARPRVNPPTGCAEKIKQLAKEGADPIVIAESFNVHLETFKGWLEEDERLAYAYTVGRALLKKELIDRLRNASLKNQTLDGNAKFLLRSVFGMSEDGEALNKKNDEKPVVPQVLLVRDFGTDAEWTARAAEQQARLIEESRTPLVAPGVPPVASSSATPGTASPGPFAATKRVNPSAPKWKSSN